MQSNSTQTLSENELVDLLTKDYLQFTLHYSLSQKGMVIQSKNNAFQTILHDDGVIEFRPLNRSKSDLSASKRIVLSCAVHGNETAPIEICNQMIAELFNGELALQHSVLFIFGNIPAMHIAKRFVDENLNRLFHPDIHSNTIEGVRARALMDFVDEFFGNEDAQQRLHYDLHTAIRPSKNDKFAVYPYLPSGKYNKEQLAFLADCDVNTILLSQEPANTFSCFSAMGYQAHAFTVELGKVMPFGQNDMTKFTAVNHKLRELISQPETSQTRFEDANIEVFTVNQVINKSKEDFALNFGNDTVNFAQFNKGDLLASETGCDFVAQHDGEAIVFPNADVAIGQRAILTVIPYEL